MGNGGIYSRQIIQCDYLVGILTPVGVVQKRVVHIGSHLNAEIGVAAVEHVAADVDIGGQEHVVVVAAVGDEVVHVEFCQVLTVLEGTVVYYHFGPGICICTTRCAILEHNLLDVLVAAKGSAVNGNGLVVIGCSYVVVEAHLAIFLVEFFIVYTYDLHIPGLCAITCRGEQFINVEVTVISSPWLNQQLHLVQQPSDAASAPYSAA